jgi:Zn-finger nucleic acid-binding protein
MGRTAVGNAHVNRKDVHCPRDKTMMRQQSAGEAVLDVCTKCGGQYFDSGEMFASFGIKADPSYWDRPETGGNIKPGELKCPLCEVAMLAQDVKYEDKHVEIDRCGKCGGIWLDRGEVETIMQIGDKLEPKLATERAKAQEELARLDNVDFGSPGLIARFLGMFSKK